MAKQQSNHVHKLRRHRYSSGNITYFCALPDCRIKITPALALGKRCICWRCGEEFILSEYAIRLAKPHCENCHKPKNVIPEAIAEQLDGAWIHPPTGKAKKEIVEMIQILEASKTNTASDLRSRLTSVIKQAEDEGDI